MITLRAPKGSPYPFMIKICCRKCGSDQICNDAIARWSEPDQQWELSSTYDFMACDDCGAENSAVERHVDIFGNDAGPVSERDCYRNEPFEPTEITYGEPKTLRVTQAEFDTMLAALRFWQREAVGVMDQFPEDDIALEHGPALTAEEIDTLCERING